MKAETLDPSWIIPMIIIALVLVIPIIVIEKRQFGSYWMLSGGFVGNVIWDLFMDYYIAHIISSVLVVIPLYIIAFFIKQKVDGEK